MIVGRVTGSRMADGRFVGEIVFPASRTGRDVTGLLVAGGRTVVGLLGMMKRLGVDGKV